MAIHKNLLDGPDPTFLPEDEQPYRMLAEESASPTQVAADFPAFCLAWAMLADDAYAAGRYVESYAYARTGYHRGLDQLRRGARPGGRRDQ